MKNQPAFASSMRENADFLSTVFKYSETSHCEQSEDVNTSYCEHIYLVSFVSLALRKDLWDVNTP